MKKPDGMSKGEWGKHLAECAMGDPFAMRRRDESPVEYYKRTKVVDDNFTRRHQGRYYCNPAHCSQSWASKVERDKHLDIAYAILD